MAETFRIALATPPFPKSIEHGMDCVGEYLREAATQGARIVCFPESFVPGYRCPDEEVAPHSPKALRDAMEKAKELARAARVALILPMDWPMDGDAPGGILNVAAVISAEGELLGCQTKNQLDPSEDTVFTPGEGRRIFEVSGVRFGVSICHEGFRYPETVRWAARQGAQVVFHPHCAGSNHSGRLLGEWSHPSNPYYERAMACRALENTIYFASVNYAFAYQESATSLVGPEGELVGYQPYGKAGLLIRDLELSRATRRLAVRWKGI